MPEFTPQQRSTWPEWALQIHHDVFVEAWVTGVAYGLDAEVLADDAAVWAMRSKELYQ